MSMVSELEFSTEKNGGVYVQKDMCIRNPRDAVYLIIIKQPLFRQTPSKLLRCVFFDMKTRIKPHFILLHHVQISRTSRGFMVKLLDSEKKFGHQQKQS